MEKEHLVNRKKFDFWDGKAYTIYELKPQNINGLKNGIKQLIEYKKLAQEKYVEKNITMILELY